ncbi:50S ribosomal protein L29 [Candidatus Saccharibacteria bacterium]|nr:50S ribosomal protein L29 [Candidatus Saccharibacteria bacterium]
MADSKKAVKAAATPKSVDEQLSEKRQDLLDYKRSHAAGELVNPTVLKATRKEIARLQTAKSAARLSEQKESK